MFRRVVQFSIVAISMAGYTASVAWAADSDRTAPDFRQVFDLIRQNLPEVSEEELYRAATEGLVENLAPRVTLVRTGANSEPASVGLTRSNLFDRSVIYLRVGVLGPGLEESVKAVWEQFSSSNKVCGVVLDLRYAKGDDYPAAVSVAKLFLQPKQPIFDWGEGMAESKEAGSIVTCPVVALINHETRGTPEALAAVLRTAGRGLILGSRTAGQAGVSKEFALANGDRLRIVTRSIRLGDGTGLQATGLVPDISLEVNPSDEKAYYENPFAVPRTGAATTLGGVAGSRTNQPSYRPRYGEAELVRDRRQGLQIDAPSVSRPRTELEAPQIQDAALSRALDLLKGLAIVHQTRS